MRKCFYIFQLTFIFCLAENNIMRWIDLTGEQESGVYDMDIWFDRAVAISMKLPRHSGKKFKKDHVVLATGVFITEELILTSYNAFRHLAKNKAARKFVTINILAKRRFKSYADVQYTLMYRNISCARQVIPMRNFEISKSQWHGKNRKFSPVHDLMVIRTDAVKFLNPNPKLYSFNLYSTSERNAGPLLSPIAQPQQPIGRNIKFASIGHMNNRQIYQNNQLRTTQFDPDDNVIVDCDKWLPRQWGYFICVNNIYKYPAMASSAILVFNNTVYGVGSFALNKGKTGVLVFTDVRAYHDLLFNTCTRSDQI